LTAVIIVPVLRYSVARFSAGFNISL